MKRYSKAIAAFLAALMCISVCMFSVYADIDDGNQPADPGGQIDVSGGEQSGEGDVPYIPDEPPVQSSDAESDIPYIPESDAGGQDYNSYNGDNQTSYESYDNSEDSNNYVYYDGDGNSYSNQEDVYVGGGQSYVPPVSTAPPASLYETDKKIDVNELSKNDWGDIANMLKKSGSTESDGDDFAFIQKNTNKGDNGHWIIIAGALCIALSITGFIYLIASNISRRKKIKAGNITRNTPQPRSAQPGRANDDYNDGYGSSSAKQSSRQPDKAKYSGGKSGKGGKRYR